MPAPLGFYTLRRIQNGLYHLRTQADRRIEELVDGPEIVLIGNLEKDLKKSSLRRGLR